MSEGCFALSVGVSTQRCLIIHPGPDREHGDSRRAASAQPAGLARPPSPHGVCSAAASQQPAAAPRQSGGQQ